MFVNKAITTTVLFATLIAAQPVPAFPASEADDKSDKGAQSDQGGIANAATCGAQKLIDSNGAVGDLMGWTVALDKERFNGRDALLAEQQRGPAWRFMGVEVDWDSLERLYAEVGLPPRLPTTAWRASVPLYVGGLQVGYATSGCWSRWFAGR